MTAAARHLHRPANDRSNEAGVAVKLNLTFSSGNKKESYASADASFFHGSARILHDKMHSWNETSSEPNESTRI
jgi:hypothetical protein